jgi:hypothetical protein
VAKTKNFDVLMSLGAGDIEEYVPRIANILSEQSAENGQFV